ncbi:ROK family protein [Duganella sp. FT80W]|uniref:ROK family protein n=1 Tax=Duganella guangzhouensis TaxID=2666084 RepID=A0A6I2KS22_9BURK|nr:ROK family protein [Duganella guangzhouensis]MRW88373.1 ROK family protein [Duganella guangzhouensis]
MTNSKTGYHGIDIGGTKIELVAYADDDAGHSAGTGAGGASAGSGAGLREVYRERIATPGTDFGEFIAAMQALVARADTALGFRAPVGIGLPGVIDSATGRQLSSNVPALNGRLVAQSLQDALQRPLAIGNDCQCFALSEAQGGAADGLPTMFGAILGTGAGGGYCIDGHLQRGLNGIAGEWGHWPLPAALLAQHSLPLLDCPCGRRGCMERYVSGPGLSNLHRHYRSADETPLSIVARAQSGSADAQHTLDVHADLLGHALASLVLALDPHAIVLGGGLSQLTHLYDKLPAAIQRHLFSGVRPPPVLPPKFGDAGGARGAALLVRQQLNT